MAQVGFEILQKPLVERLVAAACVYFGVEEAFFSQKGKDGGSEKRWTLFYLLSREAGMELRIMARRFNQSEAGIHQGIEKIESRRHVHLSIARDMNNIQGIATKLEAKLIFVDVRLSEVTDKKEEK